MKKIHELHTINHNGRDISYFYTKEKRDINGNSRYRIYIIDPAARGVYETISTTYESQIHGVVKNFLEAASHE